MKSQPKLAARLAAADEIGQRRREFREALKLAIDKEHRFGLRVDARAELDRNWDVAIEKLERLCR